MKKETLYATLVNIFGGCIFGYNTGIVSGLSAPLIKCTLFDGSMTEEQLSVYQGFFTSIILMFAMFASPTAVWIAKKKGIKYSLIIMSIIAIIFPIAMVFVKNYWYMTILRGFLGIAVGFASAICPMYTSTICENEVKGRVTTLFQLFICLSICIAQVMSYFFTPAFSSTSCTPLTTFQYSIELASSAIFGVCLLVTMIWAPNAYPSARRVASSLSIIVAPTDAEKSNVLLSWKNIKWLMFAFMLAVMNQLTGVNGVVFYAPQILDKAGVENPLLMQIIIVGVWNTVTVFIFMALVDKISRQMILNISLIIMALGCVCMILSFTLENVIYLAFAGIVLFILGFEVGPGALFFVMASQDFPAVLLDQGLSIANVIMWILNIIISFCFPIVTASLGGGVTFGILGGIQLLTLLYFDLSMKDGHMKKGDSDANLLKSEAPIVTSA